MSWGSQMCIWIPWGFCLEINLPRGVLFNPHSITTSWYECENSGKVLQRCVTNLLQWVWLNKPSDKLIQPTMRVNRSPHLDMNMKTVQMFCKDASRTFFNEFGLISHQINSFGSPWDYSDPLSLGQVSINRTGEGRHATIIYEKVRLDRPSFWFERNNQK